MYFAIRDDDTSFFTRPEELETAFSDIPLIPVSLSVIPAAAAEHGTVKPYGDVAATGWGMIADNTQLVEYIRSNMERGRYEVLMHGIHHRYLRQGDSWIPEMCCMSYDQIRTEFPAMREYLQETFGCEIKTFVAPSNSMGKEAFRWLDEQGMDTMCLLSKKMDHPVSKEYIRFYLGRNIRKALRMEEYTHVLCYRNHKELPVVELSSFENIWSYYCGCKKYDLPVIIYTHYWELNRDPEKKELLKQITDAMISDGAQACFVSTCFENHTGE